MNISRELKIEERLKRRSILQMKIYCMSDIHGCLAEFEKSLSLVLEHLEKEDTKLLLLGDYVHGGYDSKGVLDKIMSLQNHYGYDKVIPLLGNHDMWVLDGTSSIEYMDNIISEDVDEENDKYIRWLGTLKTYHVEGNTIFVHAGIDEEAGEWWEWGTGDDIYISKYPAEIGKIEGLDMKVVAGHIGTAEIARNPYFHDIYYDGESHYYIDGTVLDSGMIPVLMVDTETDKYYRVTETGNWLVLPYNEEN